MNEWKHLVAAAVIAMIPGWGHAWQARNYSIVNVVSDSTFEVIPRGRNGWSDYWCAAGQYAAEVLNASADQRIYVVRALGPAVTRNRKSAVQFSLIEPTGVDTRPGFIVTVKRVGENMQIASANGFCTGPRVGFF